MAKGGVKVRDISRIGTTHETVSRFCQKLSEVLESCRWLAEGVAEVSTRHFYQVSKGLDGL